MKETWYFGLWLGCLEFRYIIEQGSKGSLFNDLATYIVQLLPKCIKICLAHEEESHRIKQIKTLVSLPHLSDKPLCLICLPISEIKFQSEVLVTEYMLTFLFKLTNDRMYTGLAQWLDSNWLCQSNMLDIFHKLD